MVASEADVDAEASLATKQDVNSSAYVSFHNGQIFEQGLSFSGNERNKLWINEGDAFADLSDLSGADIPNDSRAVIAADFDDDGDIDLFVHSIQRERHALFRNDALVAGTDAGFLKLRLRATSGQYEGIGATVTVHGPKGPTSQVLSRGAGFVSCQVPELVFGLGAQASARVEVLWPGGAVESFGELDAGTRATLVEGTGESEAIAARTRTFLDPLSPGVQLDEGDLIPKLAVIGRDGKPTVLDVAALSDGKNVLLNLWASTCSPCVKELPLLQSREASGEVRVIALSVDVPQDMDSALRVLDKRGATFPAFFLPVAGAIAPQEGVEPVETVIDLRRLKLPTTIGLDRDGRVQTILQGPLGD